MPSAPLYCTISMTQHGVTLRLIPQVDAGFSYQRVVVQGDMPEPEDPFAVARARFIAAALGWTILAEEIMVPPCGTTAKCFKCNGPIQIQYIEHGGEKYHTDCFDYSVASRLYQAAAEGEPCDL